MRPTYAYLFDLSRETTSTEAEARGTRLKAKKAPPVLKAKKAVSGHSHGAHNTTTYEHSSLKGRAMMTSRSLNVLKKSEKGLLTEYQMKVACQVLTRDTIPF